jgi:RNA polymerase sigma-70 factor (ECF subfamily)
MSADAGSRAALLAALPRLRAFAIVWCGRTALADEALQTTLARAWDSPDLGQGSDDMLVWLCTRLRSEVHDLRRRANRPRELQQPAPQPASLREALDRLPDAPREAIILVAAAGFSDAEAARICGCTVAVLRDRAARARAELAASLGKLADAAASRDSGFAAASIRPPTAA